MKKSLQSLLVVVGMFVSTCFYASVSIADTDAIMIRWQGLSQYLNSKPNPIFVYKRIKNPVTADANGCGYASGNKGADGLEGAISQDPSAQCYIWKQVGYMSGDYGWKPDLSWDNNYVFIDPPGQKDSYGAPVAYKLAQATVDSSAGTLQSWVGLRAFTVDQLTTCTSNCITSASQNALFADTFTSSNYLIAQLNTNSGQFNIGFDYSQKLPAFYSTPQLQGGVSVSGLTSATAGDTVPIASCTRFGFNYALNSGNLEVYSECLATNKGVSWQINFGAVNYFWNWGTSSNYDTSSLVVSGLSATIANLSNTTSTANVSFTTDATKYGTGPVPTGFNLLGYTYGCSNGLYYQPINASYCLLNGQAVSVGQQAISIPYQSTPTYTCPILTSHMLQYSCREWFSGSAKTSRAVKFIFDDLYVFDSKGKTYVSWGVAGDSRISNNGITSGSTIVFNVGVNGNSVGSSTSIAPNGSPNTTTFPVSDQSGKLVLSGMLITNPSANNTPYIINTGPDSLVKQVYNRGPIIQMNSNPAVGFDSSNDLTGSLYVTSIPGYDLSKNLSFQIYPDGGYDSCAPLGSTPPPCNPTWILGSANVPFQYDAGTGEVTLGLDGQGDTLKVAPAQNYHIFGMLSSSSETYQALKGSTNDAPWNQPPLPCGTTPLPAVSGNVQLINFCQFTGANGIAGLANTNLYTLAGPKITGQTSAFSGNKLLITINFAPAQLQQADLYNQANPLNGKDCTYSFPNLASGLSVNTQPQCKGSTCFGVIDYTNFTGASFDVTIQATPPKSTSAWLAATPGNSAPYPVVAPVLNKIHANAATISSPTEMVVSWTGGDPKSPSSGLGNTVTIVATCQDANCPPDATVTVNNAKSPQNMTGLAPGHVYGVEITSVGTGFPVTPKPVQAKVNPSPQMPAYQLNDLTLDLTPSFTGSGASGTNEVTVNWRNNNSGDVYYSINNQNTYLPAASPDVPVNVNYNVVLCPGNVKTYAACQSAKIKDIQNVPYANTSGTTFTGLTQADTYSVCVQASGTVTAPAAVTNQLSGVSGCNYFIATEYAFTTTDVTFNPVKQISGQNNLDISWNAATFKGNGSTYNTDVTYTVNCTDAAGDACQQVSSGAQLRGTLGSGTGFGPLAGTDITLQVGQGKGPYTVTVTANAPSWMNVQPISGSIQTAYYTLPTTISGVSTVMGATTTDATVTWTPVAPSPATLPSGVSITYAVTATPTSTSKGSPISNTATPTCPSSCSVDLSGLTPGTPYAIKVTGTLNVNGQSFTSTGTQTNNYTPNSYTLTPLTLNPVQRSFLSTGNTVTVTWSGGDLSPNKNDVDNIGVTVKAVACLTADYNSQAQQCSQTNPPSSSLQTTNQTAPADKTLTIPGLTPGASYTLIVTATPTTTVHGQTVTPQIATTPSFYAMQYSLTGKPVIYVADTVQSPGQLAVSWTPVAIKNNVNTTTDTDVGYSVTCTPPSGQTCGISSASIGMGLGLASPSGAFDTTDTHVILSVSQAGNYTLTVTANASTQSPDYSWMDVAATSDSKPLSYYQFSSAPSAVKVAANTANNSTTDAIVTWGAAQLSPSTPDMSTDITYIVTATPTVGGVPLHSPALPSTVTSYTFNDADNTTLTPGSAYDITVTANATVNHAALPSSISLPAVPYNAYEMNQPTIAVSDVTTDDAVVTAAANITPPSEAPISYVAYACPSDKTTTQGGVTSCSSAAITGTVSADGTSHSFDGKLAPNTQYTAWVTASATVNGVRISSQSQPSQPFNTISGFNILTMPTPNSSNMQIERKIIGYDGKLQVRIPSATFSAGVSPDSVVYQVSFTHTKAGEPSIPVCSLTNTTSGSCEAPTAPSIGESYSVTIKVTATKNGVQKSLTSGSGSIAITGE